ncbi:MAG: VanZ family protein [Planctomycetota bacterium]
MLSDFIHWLSKRPRWAVGLTAIYFLATSLPHDVGQQATFRAYDLFSKRTVDIAFLAFAAIMLIGTAWFCSKRLRIASRHGSLGVLTCLGILWLVLSAGAYRWLFYTIAEVIHFPQYAVLAVLLFAVTGSHARTMFGVILLAILDEAYQYWFIYNPRFPSLLDFNDVLFDALGGAAACLLLHLDGATHRVPSRPVCWRRSPMLWGPLVVIAIAVGLHSAGVLGLYPDLEEGERTIQLSRQAMNPYWRTTPHGRVLHNLRPWEAVPLLALIVVMIGSLDRDAKNRPTK